MTPTLAGVIGLAVFLVIIMMLRMPIAYAMAIVGFAGYSILVSPSAAFRLVSIDIFTNFASYSLTVVPMFIFMGFIALYSGVGGSLFSFSSKFLGHYRGGWLWPRRLPVHYSEPFPVQCWPALLLLGVLHFRK
jgi:C4-dicarboxylate transporter DctM subunit